MLIKAVKKMTTSFKGKWDVRKWRAWYKKRKEAGNNWRLPKSWKECERTTMRDLFNYGWVVSWWALAWLNVARWRGMNDVFEQEKIFSPWIPLELRGSAANQS